MSENIFKNNVSVLQETHPHIHSQLEQERSQPSSFSVQVFKDKNRQVNALARLDNGQKVVFHNNANIIQSAREMMKDWHLEMPDILFFIGMGLGYLPLVAVEIFSNQPQVVVIEPSINIFKLALQSVDLTSLFRYDRLDLYLGTRHRGASVIDNYDFQVLLGNQRVVIHEPTKLLMGASFDLLESELKDQIGLKRDLWHTTKNIGRQMIANTIANLPGLFSSISLDKVRQTLSKTPGICVAAGPSLDKAVPRLKKIQHQVLIVAMDSAIATLVRHDIRPHMVVTCDSREENYEKLRPYLFFLRDTILVFAVESTPHNVASYPSAKRLALSGENPIVNHWLSAEFGIRCSLPAISTVSHTAIYFMMAVDIDPIILVGMDMAFPNEKSHAENAVHQYDLHATKMVTLRGVKGLYVKTYRPLVNYKMQLETSIATYQHPIINTSLDGLFIRGTLVKTLQEIVATALTDGFDVKGKLEQLVWESKFDEQDVENGLHRMEKRLNGFCKCCAETIGEIESLLNTNEVNSSLFEREEQKVKARYDSLKRDHRDLMDMIFPLRVDTVRDTAIRRLKLSASIREDKNRNGTEEVTIIRDDVESCVKASQYLLELVLRQKAYFHEVNVKSKALKDNENDVERRKELASFLKKKDLAKAEHLYREIVALFPEDAKTWKNLIEMHIENRLWRFATAMLATAKKHIPDHRDITDLQKVIDDKIDGIMATIKDEWTKGNKGTTRKLLDEYLLYRPETDQTILLKKVIRQVEASLSGEAPITNGQPKPAEHFNSLIERASRLISELEFEQGIGIIEGLIETYPDMSAMLREKIGDCRLVQKDFKSAHFNFRQAILLGNDCNDLKRKLELVLKKIAIS